MEICENCHGKLSGDGYTEVLHCETLDVIGEGHAPDANPIYCNFEEERKVYGPNTKDISAAILIFQLGEIVEVSDYEGIMWGDYKLSNISAFSIYPYRTATFSWKYIRKRRN